MIRMVVLSFYLREKSFIWTKRRKCFGCPGAVCIDVNSASLSGDALTMSGSQTQVISCITSPNFNWYNKD